MRSAHWLDYRRSGSIGKGPDKIQPDGVFESAHSYMQKLYDALKNQGATGDNLDRYMIMNYMESGAFTNNGAKVNNPGNIMWPAKGLKYGHKGPYNKVNKSYYAAFDNLDDFAKQFMIEMRKAPGRVNDATDAHDFVHRLKMNKYYGDQSEDSYYKALKGASGRLQIFQSLHDDAHQDIVIPGKDGPWKWFTDLPWYGKAGIVAGGVVITTIVVKTFTRD